MLSATVHFVDAKFYRHDRVLAANEICGEHTGDTIATSTVENLLIAKANLNYRPLLGHDIDILEDEDLIWEHEIDETMGRLSL